MRNLTATVSFALRASAALPGSPSVGDLELEMAKTEQDLRKAVRRRLGGESAAAIAQTLGRSTRWVQKWTSRYDPEVGDWAKEQNEGQGERVIEQPSR